MQESQCLPGFLSWVSMMGVMKKNMVNDKMALRLNEWQSLKSFPSVGLHVTSVALMQRMSTPGSAEIAR